MHESFQELCAAASIGDASAEELLCLGRHLVKCRVCRHAYAEFTQIAALEYARNYEANLIPEVDPEQFPLSDHLERRFLERALKEATVSRKDDAGTSKSMSSPVLAFFGLAGMGTGDWRRSARSMTAFSGALLAILFAVVLAYRLGRTTGETNHLPATTSVVPTRNIPRATPGVSESNTASAEQISRLASRLAVARAQLREEQAIADSLSRENAALSSKNDDQQLLIVQLQEKVMDADATLHSRREEIARMQSELDDKQVSFIASQARVRDLTDQLSIKSSELKGDDELLERDRDIRDLMVARNLHIFDVFDTDSRGKTRPAFGRIFYTEGKSLLFYAYDLNDGGFRNADYHYRVWGATQGQDDKAMNLGIFYSDDKAQRRWIFRCDDPKLLSHIDSVFVTLEPSGLAAAHPKGQKLLDAYLRGLANHR